MGRLITVSAKVSEELKRRTEELGVNISAVVKRALEEEVKKRELLRVLETLKEEANKPTALPEGTIVRMVREMREGRSLVQ